MDTSKMNTDLSDESCLFLYNLIREYMRKECLDADDNDLRKETDGRTSEEGLQPGTNT